MRKGWADVLLVLWATNGLSLAEIAKKSSLGLQQCEGILKDLVKNHFLMQVSDCFFISAKGKRMCKALFDFKNKAGDLWYEVF